MTEWTLFDRNWEAVATVVVPEDRDSPDVIRFRGRLFAYEQTSNNYIEADVYEAMSELGQEDGERSAHP